jgi:hypothetical protein
MPIRMVYIKGLWTPWTLSSYAPACMGVWQEVAINFLKFQPGPHALPFYVFYPFGHPMPYAYDSCLIVRLT